MRGGSLSAASRALKVAQPTVRRQIAARSPDLRRVLPSLGFELEAWVVMHEDLRHVRRVRAVFDHLVAHLAAYGARRGGRRPRTSA